MSSGDSVSTVVERLLGEANTQALAEHVYRAALLAAESRDARFGSGPGEPQAPSLEPALSTELAETPFGNVVSILRKGAQSRSERVLLGALVALGASRDLPSAPESELALAAKLAWLATHTPVDALV